jgi:hypothetical protein
MRVQIFIKNYFNFFVIKFLRHDVYIIYTMVHKLL